MIDYSQREVRIKRVGLLVVVVIERVDSGVPEQFILQEVAARVSAVVDGAVMDQVVRFAREQRVSVVAGGLELLGSEISERIAMKLIGAALGYDVDDAAKRLSVLWFKTTGLNLDFLNEIEIDAVPEGAVNAAVGPEAAKPWVGGVCTIDDVFVFKAGSTIDGGIG